MSDKPTSPFAGIKLSEPAQTSAGPDQRLFTSPPTPDDRQLGQASKKPTLQPRKVATKEPWNLGTKPELPLDVGGTAPPFDLDEQPYRNDTFAFTDDELEAIEDLKIDLRRKFDIRATKNSLVRCAVHLLIEDYRKNQGTSLAVQRHRAKAK